MTHMIESSVEDLLRTTRVPGLAVSYARGGRVAWSKRFCPVDGPLVEYVHTPWVANHARLTRITARMGVVANFGLTAWACATLTRDDTIRTKQQICGTLQMGSRISALP
jgi:hypothetical protein